MKKFTTVEDVIDIPELIDLARGFKKDPFKTDIGLNKTLGMLFFNPSLRTRLSTEKAAQNLGMKTLSMNVNNDSWQLETEDGVIMDGNKAEHIKEAAAVVGQYCDVLGIRSFPGLKDKEEDYAETVLNAFMRHAGIPIVNLESATLHPLQSLTDLLTIEEYKKIERPKVVLTWAPHVKPLPQSVGNSFAQWANKTDYNFIVCAPKGMELSSDFLGDARFTNNQMEAFEERFCLCQKLGLLQKLWTVRSTPRLDY